MAEIDWVFLTDSLDPATVDRGVTTGVARPPGGGNFVYGFNSLTTAQGVVGLFTNQAHFAPMAKGGSVRGALQRGASEGAQGFAPFLFASLQGPSVEDRGYLLGLGDADPHHIVLCKGVVAEGVPDVTPGNGSVLRRSSATFAPGTWLHLRLDVIANQNGDVILQVLQNDLAAHPIGGAPAWVPVPGMDQFIDDALGISTGGKAFTSGRAGFGLFSADAGRRAFFDQLEIFRQTA